MNNNDSNSSEVITANLLRLAGYGLLLLTLSNFGDALLPPQFGKDAAWEFSALGKLVGTSPVPIIGLVLIFYGESTARSTFGKKILKFLSWLSLLLSIFYVVMLLIGISAAIRINNDNNTQASFALSQQLTQFNTAKENLKNADDANLKRVAEIIERQSPNLKLDKGNPVELRKQLDAEIGKNEASIKSRIEDGKSKAFRQLIKQAGKWYFEAIVSAFILIGIWSQTKWTRSVPVRRKKKGAKSATSLSDIASAPTLDVEHSDSQREDEEEN